MNRMEELVAEAFKRVGLSSERARTIHREIVGEMAEGKLTCLHCEHVESLDAAKVETYLSGGWPLCHGATMSYEGPTPKGGAK